jgi:hypothetical protein
LINTVAGAPQLSQSSQNCACAKEASPRPAIAELVRMRPSYKKPLPVHEVPSAPPQKTRQQRCRAAAQLLDASRLRRPLREPEEALGSPQRRVQQVAQVRGFRAARRELERRVHLRGLRVGASRLFDERRRPPRILRSAQHHIVPAIAIATAVAGSLLPLSLRLSLALDICETRR